MDIPVGGRFKYFDFHLHLGKWSNSTIFSAGLKPPTNFEQSGKVLLHDQKVKKKTCLVCFFSSPLSYVLKHRWWEQSRNSLVLEISIAWCQSWCFSMFTLISGNIFSMFNHHLHFELLPCYPLSGRVAKLNSNLIYDSPIVYLPTVTLKHQPLM